MSNCAVVTKYDALKDRILELLTIAKRELLWYTTTRSRPVGQAAKTLASHAGNMGSIPVRVTKRNKSELFRKSKLVRICFLL